MGTNAVAQYVKTQLTGLHLVAASVDFGTCEPHYMPVPVPTPTIDAKVLVYIWPDLEQETHPTYSGPGGYRRVHYSPLMLTVLKPLPPTEAGMQGFPILVDLLKSIVRGWAAGLPIGLTDPATGANSYITLIGEQFTTRYYRPAVVSTMRSVLARCDLGADLWEQETA